MMVYHDGQPGDQMFVQLRNLRQDFVPTDITKLWELRTKCI
jgi:hypothetical protein